MEGMQNEILKLYTYDGAIWHNIITWDYTVKVIKAVKSEELVDLDNILLQLL